MLKTVVLWTEGKWKLLQGVSGKCSDNSKYNNFPAYLLVKEYLKNPASCEILEFSFIKDQNIQALIIASLWSEGQ